MAKTKTTKTPALSSNANSKQQSPPVNEPWTMLDPKLRSVKSYVDKGDYEQALAVIPNSNSDHELQNCRAVCLMRMRKFAQAIGPLRSIALNTSTFHVRSEVADHIKINYAIALFYGGEPAGSLEILSDIKMEDDPSVKMLRMQVDEWTASMNIFRRIDWYLNRIAPKSGPKPPAAPVGRFVWELDSVASLPTNP